MHETKVFFDSNIVLYLLSAEPDKANRIEQLMESGGMISIQVLNEITNVARRKLNMSWKNIKELLSVLRNICQLAPFNIETHDKALQIAERYQLSVYDALIVSSALLGGSKILYSEDMHSGLLIDKQLLVSNPFIN